MKAVTTMFSFNESIFPLAQKLFYLENTCVYSVFWMANASSFYFVYLCIYNIHLFILLFFRGLGSDPSALELKSLGHLSTVNTSIADSGTVPKSGWWGDPERDSCILGNSLWEMWTQPYSNTIAGCHRICVVQLQHLLCLHKPSYLHTTGSFCPLSWTVKCAVTLLAVGSQTNSVRTSTRCRSVHVRGVNSLMWKLSAKFSLIL